MCVLRRPMVHIRACPALLRSIRLYFIIRERCNSVDPEFSVLIGPRYF